MTTQVHLLYFKGCPNVNQARENLKSAFAQADLNPGWDEVNLEDPGAPVIWRGFPSPTVLVDGRDIVTGAQSASGAGACRVGGAPDTGLILRNLPRGGIWRRFAAALGAIPSAALGFFPAVFCPACYPVLAGLLSAAGLGFLVNDTVLKPLTIFFLFVALFGFAWQAARTGRYPALVIGSLGAAGMYTGLYLFPSVPLKMAGIAALFTASLWNLILKRNSGNDGGPMCAACKVKGEKNE